MKIFNWLRRKQKESSLKSPVEVALAKLSDASEEEKSNVAIELLKSSDPDIKKSVAIEIARMKIKSAGVSFELVNALGDFSKSVRRVSAEVLWKLEHIDFAIRSLRDEYEAQAHMNREEVRRAIYTLDRAAPVETNFENLLKENWKDCPISGCDEADKILRLAKNGSNESLIKLVKMLGKATVSGEANTVNRIQSTLKRYVDREKFTNAVRTLPKSEQDAILDAVRPKKEESVELLIDELVKLCTEVNGNYKRLPYSEAQKAQQQLEVRIREIGQKLFDQGGGEKKLMLEAHALVASRCIYGRYLEGAWSGIGDWMG